MQKLTLDQHKVRMNTRRQSYVALAGVTGFDDILPSASKAKRISHLNRKARRRMASPSYQAMIKREAALALQRAAARA